MDYNCYYKRGKNILNIRIRDPDKWCVFILQSLIYFRNRRIIPIKWLSLLIGVCIKPNRLYEIFE